MIEEILTAPNTMVAIKVGADSTKDEFDSTALPAISELLKRIEKLNYLLVVDDSLTNLSIIYWTNDALILLNQADKWNRTAIVSNAQEFQNLLSKIENEIPGEFKTFGSEEVEQAMAWVAEDTKPNVEPKPTPTD